MEQTRDGADRASAREEFAAAVTEHSHGMFRAARSILDSDADAEDAVGEAVLRAWQSWDRLRAWGAVRAWLLKIAVNCAYEQRRKTGRVDCTDQLEAPAPFPNLDARCDLWTALTRLPRDQKAVVVLFYYEDMTEEQIASLLAVPRGTVKSRLSRAREHLRRLLREEET